MERGPLARPRCARSLAAAIDPAARAALPSSLEDREERTTPRTVQRAKWPSPVVDLADARDDRRLRDHQARLRTVLDTNRKAISRLFQSGLIFTRAGARLGRDLLLAHQHLLKAGDLLARLAEARGAEAEALYGEVQALLARTSELSARSDGLLARER